ncbi:PEP/pyruvate-binding domain-containing protein [Candidatus Dojkabacteria bacterium]|nr:PEP/pyruvate-binding domain-containing protein [Candidatus Dojkabacteria bacterium]
MKIKDKYTIFLENYDLKQEEAFGQRAKDFYDLVHLNVSVPSTFFVNSSAFDDFIHGNNLSEYIIERLLGVNIDNSRDLEKTSKEIKEAIMSGSISKELEEELSTCYSRLSGFSDSLVSMTYSPINPDLDYSSFSEKSFVHLNIRGKDELIDTVKLIWTSLFEPKAIFYREAKRYSGALTVAVVVQKLIFAESSGVLFTVDPITNDSTKAQIEAILGVIDPLVDSELNPDVYIYDKVLGTITEKNTVNQDWMLVRKGRVKGNESPHAKVNISPVYKKLQKIDDTYLDYLGKLAVTLDKYNESPLEVEWVLESGRISVTRIRPVTTLTINETDWKFAPTVTALKSKLESREKTVNNQSGSLSLQEFQVKNRSDYEEQMTEISEMIPGKGDLVPISPDIGVPKLSPPSMIQEKKKAIMGEDVKSTEELVVQEEILVNRAFPVSDDLSTVTKIFYEVENKQGVEKISNLPLDGVVAQFNKSLLDKEMGSVLLEAASRAGEKPVLFSLFSNGSVNDIELKKQIVTLKQVRNKSNKKNVWVTIPAFHDKQEIIEVKKLISTIGLKRSSTFKIFLSINSPAAAMQILEFIDIGIDGILINFSKFAALSLDKKVGDVQSSDLLKNEAIEKILRGLVMDINRSKIDSIIVFDHLEIDEKILTKLVEIGTIGFSTELTTIPGLKKHLQSIEAEKILRHKGGKAHK